MPVPGAALLLTVWIAMGQQPERSGPASVSGRVIDAASGRPIPGVTVAPAGPAVPLGPAMPLPPRALTNSEGEFVLRGLRAGMVYFTAAKNGYADAGYGQRRPNGSGQGVRLAAGENTAGVEIRMWRHAAISGTVADEAGEPAVGVRVQAFSRWFVAGRKRYHPVASAVTDDRGVYRIANLTPGDYAIGVLTTQRAVPNDVMNVFFGGADTVSQEQRGRISRELGAIGAPVVPPGTQYGIGVGDQTMALPAGSLIPQVTRGGTLAVYPTLFYPASPTLSQAAAVSVRSGEERSSIDLQMHPSASARVSGTVVAPDGPAANVGVRLVPAAADDVVEAIEVATTITSSSGAFAFPAVPAGQYVLTVLRPPRDPIDPQNDGPRLASGGQITIGTAAPPARLGPPPPPPVPADATLCAQLPISVGDSALTDLVVPLTSGPRVTGRVEFEGSGEKPSAAALTGIRLNLDPADGSKIADASLAFEAGHPGEDGQFRTLGVPPGRYVLRVNAPGGWFLKGAFLGSTDLTDTPFELTSKDLSGVVLTYTDRPASLRGVVRDGLKTDPDAVVLAYPADPSGWSARGAFPRRMRTARADKDGAFTFDNLPPGEYLVVAVHEDAFGDWQDPALLEALSRVARQIRLTDGERRTENLTAAIIR